MDAALAQSFLSELRGRRVDDYLLTQLAGAGKSAAVFEAEHPTHGLCCVKVYDAEFLERFGGETAKSRLEREAALGAHSCPSLVKVVGHGETRVAGRDTTYLAMEKVDGEDLDKLIRNKKFGDHEIRKCLADLHAAADFLLDKNLCHRDIKPANIRLTQEGNFVLLDLGVLRPIGAVSDLTEDERGRLFISTLRYAPPELLHRRESDNAQGWTAINLYQIGAVLYELIKGDLLFGNIWEPFADLVSAIDHEAPSLFRSDVGSDLVTLTLNCLNKSFENRLSLVAWSVLPSIASTQYHPSSSSIPEVDQEIEARKAAYARRVLQPQQELQRARVRQQEARQIGIKATEKAANRVCDPYAKAAVSGARNRQVSWVDMLFPESLADGFVGTMGIFLAVEAHPTVEGHVRVRGMGVWSTTCTTKNPGTLRLVVTSPNLSESLAPIFEGPSQPELVSEAVESWASAAIANYFKFSRDRFEAAIQRQEDLLTPQARSTSVVIQELGEIQVWTFTPDSRQQFRNPQVNQRLIR